MSQLPPKRARRLPRLLLALLMGGIAAALVFAYVGRMQAQLAQRPVEVVLAPTPTAAPTQTPLATPTPLPRTAIVVARQDLPAGLLLKPEYFEVRELLVEAVLPNALVKLDDVSGRELTVPLAAGEQILTTKLAAPRAVPTALRLADLIPPGKRAISVEFTDLLGSGGLVVPGDHVDVIATFTKETMGKDQAMILLQDVLVLAIERSTSPEGVAEPTAQPEPSGDSGGLAALPATTPAADASAAGTGTPVTMVAAPREATTVTLAVSPEAAERLALAEDLGQLRYALRRTGDRSDSDIAVADLATLMSPIQPAKAEIIAVEISPANIKVGDTVTVKITVKNTSDQPLRTQGPAPGYAYVQGQTYFSQQFPSETGTWRVGIGSAGLDSTDIPYRWGLGADLPPGATTTVSGQIKITYDFQAVNFWATLIEEPATKAQDGVGMTMITSLPENIAVVAVDVANVRSGPSIASSVIGQEKYGAQLPILDKSADWFKVRLADQREGWVAAGWIIAPTQ